MVKNALDKRYDKYDKEQEKIIRTVKEEVKEFGTNREWNKYKGNIAAQVIIDHIKPYLPKKLTIVGHDYFIHKYQTEWDAMIVKKNAKPKFNMYKSKDVNVVIEIKASGFFGISQIETSRTKFKVMEKKRIKGMVVAIRSSPTRKKEIKRRLKHSFVLSRSQNWNVNIYKDKCNGEWKKLVDFVKKL